MEKSREKLRTLLRMDGEYGLWSSYSPTVILEDVLGLFLQMFLYLEAFESNTSSDWLSQMVKPPIRK